MYDEIIDWYNQFGGLHVDKVYNGLLVTNNVTNKKRFFEYGHFTKNQFIAWCDTLVTKWSKN